MKSIPITGFLDTFQVVKQPNNACNINKNEDKIIEDENNCSKEVIFQTKQTKEIKDRNLDLNRNISCKTINSNGNSNCNFLLNVKS